MASALSVCLSPKAPASPPLLHLFVLLSLSGLPPPFSSPGLQSQPFQAACRPGTHPGGAHGARSALTQAPIPRPEAAGLASKPRAGQLAGRVPEAGSGLGQCPPYPLIPAGRTQDRREQDGAGVLTGRGSREPVWQAPPRPLSSVGTRRPKDHKLRDLDPLPGRRAGWLPTPEPVPLGPQDCPSHVSHSVNTLEASGSAVPGSPPHVDTQLPLQLRPPEGQDADTEFWALSPPGLELCAALQREQRAGQAAPPVTGRIEVHPESHTED